MVREVVIHNESGLHARPATLFVYNARKFESKIAIEKEGKQVNGKSVLLVLSLGIAKGTKIKIMANGSDEEKALSTLINLIENDFISAGI